MHINARDLPPSKAFCFIIEYPPYDEDVKEATLGPNRAQIDESIITYNL